MGDSTEKVLPIAGRRTILITSALPYDVTHLRNIIGCIPAWIESLAKESDGHGIQFIMTKRITNSDWNPHQNRLLIPKQSVNEIQLMLSPEEKTLANLNPTVTIDRGGLDIRVFTRNKFRVEELKLRRWDGTGSSVINGRGMNVFRAWSDLNVADIAEMWGFRDGGDGKLCFAIGKV